MKSFSLDWWWSKFLDAHKQIQLNARAMQGLTVFRASDEYHERHIKRYVTLRNYIRKRIEAKVIAQHRMEGEG